MLDQVELYDPVTGSWTITGKMHHTRQGHTASILADGKVLAAGGFYLNSAELYDPLSELCTATASMNSIRQ